MRFDSLRDALIYELQDLYSGENQLVSGVPRLIEGAASPELKGALISHVEETRNQVIRLRKIFAIMEIAPPLKPCQAMQRMLAEGNEIVESSGDTKVKDALLIGIAQRVEHYEMAGYGTAKAFAYTLGLDQVAGLLQQTLEEEGAANKKLTSLAEGGWIEPGLNSIAT